MSFIHNRDDVTCFFKDLGYSINEDAIDTFLSFLSMVEVDKETLEAIVEAFSTNNKLKEFNYKQTLQLNDYILKQNGVTEKNSGDGKKRFQDEMSAPTTPLKKQRSDPVSLTTTMMTPVSGRVYDISDSPSKRHNQSPKTWPTPTKSEAFHSRKERNVVKMNFEKIDSNICDESANHAEQFEYVIDPSIGEQEVRCRYVPSVEDKESLRSNLMSARERMSEQYEKSFSNISYETEQEVCVCGVIFFDIHSSTVLKDSSIFLYDENDSKVSLILSEVPSFTLFPGQIVGVEGIMNNRRIQVTHLYPGYPVELPKKSLEVTQEGSYSIVVVRGPYSSRDDDQYEQLKEFVKMMNTTCPDLIIMCGPFVPEGCMNALSFSSQLDTKVLNIIKELSAYVLLVPALEEIAALPVFPQSPYEIKKSQKLQSCGNPSFIDINHNLSIGILNADLLKDLMVNSYRKQDKGVDNQSLFCSQILEQHSLYPLYPASGFPFDTSRIRTLQMPELPDVFVIATDKMKFIKEVKGVLFVSPGPLALGNGGGTYAQIQVYPYKKEYIDSLKENGESNIENNVVKRCKVQTVCFIMSFHFLKGHKESITCLLNHPKGIASGSEDKTVRLWDTRANRAVRCITGDLYDEVSCLSDYPQNENIICVGCDTAVFFYDLRNPNVILKSSDRCIMINNDCVNRIRPFTMDGNICLGICDDAGDIIVWDDVKKENQIAIEGIHKSICGDFIVRTQDDGIHFISGGYDQAIADTLITGEVVDHWSINPLSTSLPSVNPPFVICLTECASNHRLYCGCGDGSIRHVFKSDGENRVNEVITVHTSSISDMQSIEKGNHHYILSTGNDLLFTVHEETNQEYSVFSEKSRLEMKWKTNCFIVVDDTVFFGGLSNQILCANGIFRCSFVFYNICTYIRSSTT